MATSYTEDRRLALAHASAKERICAMRFQETILERLGKTLRGHDEDITHEPLPRRWVDLILFLEEKERKRSERGQVEVERRVSRASRKI